MKLPKRVTLCEVGTRDGFQIEPDFIPTERKIENVIILGVHLNMCVLGRPFAIRQMVYHARTRCWCAT